MTAPAAQRPVTRRPRRVCPPAPRALYIVQTPAALPDETTGQPRRRYLGTAWAPAWEGEGR